MPIQISYRLANGPLERTAYSEREAQEVISEVRAAGASDILVRRKDRTLASRPQPLMPIDSRIDPSLHSISLADARQPDYPLVYVNKGFERLTGYRREECLGRSCRFLQGQEQSQEARRQMRSAIEAEEPLLLDVLNVRKDGTRFWNRLSLKPVRNTAGELTHIIGIQSDVTPLLALQKTLEAWIADVVPTADD